MFFFSNFISLKKKLISAVLILLLITSALFFLPKVKYRIIDQTAYQLSLIEPKNDYIETKVEDTIVAFAREEYFIPLKYYLMMNSALKIFKDNIIRHTSVIPFGGNIITEDIKEGCSIIEKQAELLKIKFGSAWPGENKENEIVSIPGLRGRDPKEITLKNLSKIIHARVVEIIEQVYIEIKNYGHEEQKKKLIGGIVLTGGGSQLKHLKQLVEYITGMDTRLGYPSEHLAGNNSIEISSPMYATAVGLVMNSTKVKKNNKENNEGEIDNYNTESESEKVERTTIFERFTQSLKTFLDNAE